VSAWLEGFIQWGSVARELAVIGLLATGALIVLVRDWRVTILALLSQYVLAGLILSRLVLPEIALIKVLVGALICPMLYLAARQSGWSLSSLAGAAAPAFRAGHADGAEDDVFRASLPFRLLAVVLAFLVTIVLNQAQPPPAIPPDVGLGSYWLMVVGVLVLILTEAPLKAGPGLLTALTGFDLIYTPLERSLVMVLLLAVIDLLLTLAVTYLAVVRGMRTLEGER